MKFFRAVLLILLMSFITQNSDNELIYTLSPSIPPQAYLDQYYTCDFRVPGLIDPTFSFNNLPSFLKWSPNGRIQGTPNQRGTFTISVSYSSGKKSGQTEFILSVRSLEKGSASQKVQSDLFPAKQYDYSTQLVTFYPQIPCLYNTGDKISLNLSYYVGASNKIWTYQQLPSGLTGTVNGKISGTIHNEGLYSFAAMNSDQNGRTQTYIITFNIQPSYFYAYWGGYLLDDVPVRDSCLCYNKAIETQRLASILVDQAKRAVNKYEKKLNQAKEQISKNAVGLTLAQSKLKVQTQLRQLILAKQSFLVKNAQSTKDRYSQANQTYQLAVTAVNNMKLNFQNATNVLKQATNNFKISQSTLQNVNKAFIQAQNASSSAASDICDLQVKIAGYKADVQGSFAAVNLAKQNLINYQNILMNNSFDVSNAQNARDIASLQNDMANSDYNAKLAVANKTLLELNKAHQNITQIKDDLSTAFIYLGQAKFNLTQAMNQLLVAQAAKAQSDKAMAIMSSQLSKTTNSTNSTFIFGGCQIGSYPSFSGTLGVTGLTSSGVKLASGHTLLYGNCTKKVQIAKGDLISFVGYLKEGVIHALSVSK